MMLTDRNFEEEIFNSNIPVLVEFWGSWCPPCQREKEVIKRLEEQYAGRIRIAELNIDRNPSTALKFHIKGVPTYIIFNDGRIVHRDIAAKSEKQMKQMIQKILRKTDFL